MFVSSVAVQVVTSGEVITRTEEPYRLCVGLIVCDMETSTVRRLRIDFGCRVTQNESFCVSVASVITHTYGCFKMKFC